MKIVYFYQYFTTPNGSYGTRVYEFTSNWVKAGHDVTVVTSLYAKSDLKAIKLIENQEFEGVKVKVLNIKIDNKQSFIKRIYTFIQYSILSTWYALSLPADVVIASSGPITIGLPGLAAKYLRKRKLVFEARDLWPDVAIELGILKNKWIIKFAYWFEKFCYNSSDLIVGLSPGMKKHIGEKCKHSNIISITNAANIELFSTLKKFPEKSNLLLPFKYAIYTGNIGEVNNSVWLLNTARILKELDREDIIILLVGDGQQKDYLIEIAEKENIVNFIHLNLMPKLELVGLIQHAMVSLVPLKAAAVLATSSPNKFFESLAAGTPVIQNTNGWMEDFLEIHQIGFTLDPENPIKLAEKLIELDGDPNIRNKIQIKAMEIAATHFDKDVLAGRMLQQMEKLLI